MQFLAIHSPATQALLSLSISALQQTVTYSYLANSPLFSQLILKSNTTVCHPTEGGFHTHTMKTKSLLLLVVLAAILLQALPAQAFYDARQGRCINRDPIEEHGGINLHIFARNDLIDDFDIES